MRYYTIPPPRALADFVKCFWVLESDAPGYVHRSMAEVNCEMVFHYKGKFDELFDNGKIESSFTSGVQGPSDKIRRFSIKQCFGIFGVYFYPYAMPLLFKVSAAELTNQMIDIKTLFGNTGSELEEKIMQAASTKDRVQILINFLEPRLAPLAPSKRSIFNAVNHIVASDGNVRINELADAYALSERQFERKFKSCAGLSPKLFSRIVRFHSTMQHYGAQDKSLTQIAHDCGYYDQSHFIHEFKQFSGHHPKEYFYGSAEGTAWRN
jgi:AraC-like DNA-binding protein